ncbi:hypothetical protein GARC_3243 [Paraglaciecola arctica BSs20135]|uniref:Uncharacterized protein n=1 Tax=Paraglaciecola arctica BSs20135 TaxID=493475 RepID=K6YPV2_9ALTE|nr:hypothetical protein GARC_3243 [Paraglaciecola arctica BSs20135]
MKNQWDHIATEIINVSYEQYQFKIPKVSAINKLLKFGGRIEYWEPSDVSRT